MVSAFAARQRQVLSQFKVADKSNEVVAIPTLLSSLTIERTGKAIGVRVDVTDRAQVRAMIKTAVSQFGTVDVMFNTRTLKA
jgi:NAD(P)-dependent dehydrogenase (short-subunit alcohol dehydrogenase family)